MTDPFDNDVQPDPADTPAFEALTLYRVDGRGRVNLSGIVADGVEFYTAIRGAANGTIILAPVKVATTAVKRSGADDTE